MKILIIGATGSIGRALTEKLKTQSVDLVLLAHHATALKVAGDQITKVDADATDVSALTAAMTGVTSIFIASSGDLPAQAKAILQAAQQTTVKKIVFIASMGIYNEIPAKGGETGNLHHNGILAPYRQAADLIEASDFATTIIRPGWFDNGPANYEVTTRDEPFGGHDVSRAAIADLASKALLDINYANHESLGINRPE